MCERDLASVEWKFHIHLSYCGVFQNSSLENSMHGQAQHGVVAIPGICRCSLNPNCNVVLPLITHTLSYHRFFVTDLVCEVISGASVSSLLFLRRNALR